MTKNIIFKTLIDILYFLHFFGLLGIFFMIPYGVINFNQVDIKAQDWSLSHWLIAIVSIIAYVVFLRGIYFLRKLARFLLTNNYFSEKGIAHLKKSGIHFLSTGFISLAVVVLVWLVNLLDGELKLTYDLSLIIPLFLSIIGMFFIIQSNSLQLAKGFKEENELTI